jgi:hypothetical protein
MDNKETLELKRLRIPKGWHSGAILSHHSTLSGSQGRQNMAQRIITCYTIIKQEFFF